MSALARFGSWLLRGPHRHEPDGRALASLWLADDGPRLVEVERCGCGAVRPVDAVHGDDWIRGEEVAT